MKSILWIKSLVMCCMALLVSTSTQAQDKSMLWRRQVNGQLWLDADGNHINAHGGNIIRYGKTYYWYGENRPYSGGSTEAGISVYSSQDLMTWKNEGVALATSTEAGHDIQRGCIMERPKVIYNKKTRKFVMLFHLELRGRGYEAARVAFAVSDLPTGPFRFIRSQRIHANQWPFDMDEAAIRAAQQTDASQWKEWWTDAWRREVEKGMYLWRDMKGGQMSRDMTVYVDDDGKAYRQVQHGGTWGAERSPLYPQAQGYLLAYLLRLHRVVAQRSPYVQCQKHLGTVAATPFPLYWCGTGKPRYACQQDLWSTRHLHLQDERQTCLHGRHLESSPPLTEPAFVAPHRI